ncbi:catalytic [Niastella koreensis]|uniref:Catalytic, putative n=2 Tax=Niastella koreensis TaxID=354356 RepID=G8TN59_NIAKG|nr:alpha/beta hydrolase [Niastella koreensis]AEV97744.1 catalytic, putative [Niastella koreensis GR20-10]OQP40440.1 catalytic [Niastella koreensis]
MNAIFHKQSCQLFLLVLILLSHKSGTAQSGKYVAVNKVASDFKTLLKRPTTPFQPSFEITRTDSVIIEKGFIYSEANEKIPILIYKPVHTKLKSFPVVICLHGTGGSKDQGDIKRFLYKFSTMGIMGIAIDARYHGERLTESLKAQNGYVGAITRAWQNTDTKHQEHPFYFDTVYDLWRLTDYLTTRPDVQANRIGMTGISMGGIETWMAASVDKRIKVAVPMIAVQSFKWSLENDKWQGRVNTIRKAHEQAAKDLGDSTINKQNILQLWNKVVPGITDEFDCPSMIRLFAPRPLLILNSEKDMNCPLGGATIAFKAATAAYEAAHAIDKLKIYVAPNTPHKVTPAHEQMMVEWFGKWL